MEIWLISLILLVAILLLVTEWMPLDFTAMGILVVLMTSGILTVEEALRGFSSPAVITIGSMFIVSRGLARTGALELISDRMIEHSQGDERWILIMSMVGTAIPSAFINNTPIVVMFVTVIMSVCCEYGLSPSKYLIPVSYASIVGGTCTLVGTSTNLIVSDLSWKYGYGALSMFELAPVGMAITVVTLLILYFAAPRFMPDHKAPVCELKPKDAPHYLAEVMVPDGSKLIDQDPLSFFKEKYPDIELFEVIRGPTIYFPERERVNIAKNDLLLLKGSVNELIAMLNDKVVQLPHQIDGVNFKPRQDKFLIVELIITPRSRLLGLQPIEINLQAELGIQIIAIKRRRTHYSQQKIRHLRLTIGDVLLVNCPRDRLDEIRTSPDFIILDDIHHRIVDRRKAPLSISILVGMILTASTGLADITVCAITAVFLMVMSGCLNLRDAYRSADVPLLLTIVGTIALGTAMGKTGAAKVYADLFLIPMQGQSPLLVLGAFILLTVLLTEVMSNSATAVLLIPIGISTALSIGVDPKPFIMGICFGASCAFAIPIGYQTHLLVYGPGGYRSRDYLKLGIPLDLITWLIATLMIPFFWPF